MNKKMAHKHLFRLREEYIAGRIDEDQLDASLVVFLEVLRLEIAQEEAAPKVVDLAAVVEALRSEVAEIKAMIAALASPPAYRVDTVTMNPPAWEVPR